MEVVLLEPGEEEGLVPAHRPAGGESENIVGENRLRNTRQLVKIGNRVKALRLVTPQQGAVQVVRAGFRDDIEHAPARAPKLDAKVAGLNRNFFNGVGNGKHLLRAAQPDIVVFGSV